ncbi:MAG: ABC transporter substrate-binding protein [Lachnospiraceae bacterium]|nr:ABC transporter substrate-binding protein [Lachnospiraceae bacterium]
MKKIIAFVLSVSLLLTGCAGSSKTASSGESKNNTLKLFIWGEYLGTDVISNFEDEYDAKVIIEYFDSNEMMYTKFQAGDSYDILVPSDYMIERLIKEDLLQPLNKEEIPNLTSLRDAFKGLSYDPDNTYSVPYFGGSVGITYNKNEVPLSLLEKEGFSIMKNTDYKGKIYMYDSERDSFMIALKALGYSVNTENEDEINEAYGWLKELNDTMDPIYVTDEVIDNMLNGAKDMAIMYSGDAAYVISENEDMGYYTPLEGTNIWTDAMVIPANAENPELANKFINYMLTYDAAYDNTETVGYTTMNKEVFDEITGKGGIFEDNEAYVPREGYDKDEIFHDNENLRKIISELWIKVKAS